MNRAWMPLVTLFLMAACADTQATSVSLESPKSPKSTLVLVDPAIRTCGKWMEHRQSAGDDEMEDAAWVYGFFSGYNTFSPRPVHPFFTYDGAHLLEQIDKYCAASPNEHIASAAITFLKSMKKYPKDEISSKK